MINKEQLVMLNRMKCVKHKDTPQASYKGEDIDYKYCCDEFDNLIRSYIREKTLENLQKITRNKLGI
jgi:hypothetical protein